MAGQGGVQDKVQKAPGTAGMMDEIDTVMTIEEGATAQLQPARRESPAGAKGKSDVRGSVRPCPGHHPECLCRLRRGPGGASPHAQAWQGQGDRVRRLADLHRHGGGVKLGQGEASRGACSISIPG